MLNQFSRTELIFGKEAMEQLASARVADISETKVCPLVRVMRYELKKRGIKAIPHNYRRMNEVHTMALVYALFVYFISQYIHLQSLKNSV